MAAFNILANGFIWRNPISSGLARGREGPNKIASAIIDNMPDCQITHEDTVEHK